MIASRDLGGAGAPVLLLHGAGANLESMVPLGRRLAAAGFRPVLADLRGHGESPDGPWEWPAVLDDLETLGLARPFVVGVSLGGMVAALWGTRHPDCPGIVSIDGNPPPSSVAQLPGLADAEAALDRLRKTFDAMAAVPSAPLPADRVDAMIAATRASAAGFGAEESEAWVATFTRNLRRRDGEVFGWPSREGFLAELRAEMDSLDLRTLYGAVRCPALVLLATKDLPQQEPFAELYAAHRAHIRGVLEMLPGIRAEPVPDASHAMAAEHPDDIAARIVAFLRAG